MAMAVGARLVNESITVGGLTALALELLGFSMAVAGYSALFSALSSSRGKAAGVASGLTVASYLAFVVSGLSDRWNWLEHLSTFAAYQPQL